MNVVDNQFEWNAALALNNRAITMIERNCFRQAAHTLKDALLVMQLCSADDCTRDRLHQQVNEKLQKANRRLFAPEVSSLLPTPVKVKVVHHHGAIDGSAHDVLTDQSYCVVRMEPNDTHLQEASDILLYNAAICWMVGCYGKRAAEALHMTLDSLSDLYNAASCPFAVDRMLYLLMITSNALVQALEMSGQRERAATLRTTLLVQLRESTQMSVVSGLMSSCALNVASPAA
jgi:hypothetical protein